MKTENNRPFRIEAIRIALVLVLFAECGMLLANQGWRAQIMNIDLIPYPEALSQLFQAGIFPERGVLTSYQSFTPPGIAYLMLPGMLVFDDPRLFEIVGASCTYVGTLIGIWLLTEQAYRRRCAMLAVMCYALSGQGFFFARSLWPRAHPFFFVWMTYWTLRWVKQRQGRFLAAAVFTWSIGLYMFLEIAPAILIFPVIWLRYRPPVKVRSLAMTGIVILLIWLPYLRFEYHRDFADVRSQIFRQTLAAGDERATWCDPTLPLETWPEQAAVSPVKQSAWWFPQTTNLFKRAWNRFYWTTRYTGDKLVWTTWWNGVNNFKMAYQSSIPIALLGFVLTSGVVIAAVVADVRQWRNVCGSEKGVIAICLLTPWLALWLLTDAGRADRFWWLWPLQAIFLAAVFTEFFENVMHSKKLAMACQLLILLLIATQPRIMQKIDAWRRDGWSGRDHERIQASDLLARQFRATGITQAAIGYQVLMYGWEPEFHRHDPQYKVGADFDFYLQRKHGIINTNRCAEGIAAFDDYRIVQTARTTDLNRYLRVHDWDKYEPIGEIGAYRIVKRKEQAE